MSDIIVDTLHRLDMLSRLGATETHRYRMRNPSRMVTPIIISQPEHHVLAYNGTTLQGHTRWHDMTADPNIKPTAVHICDLHNIRNVWFD